MKFLGEEDLRVREGGQYSEEWGVGILGFALPIFPYFVFTNAGVYTTKLLGFLLIQFDL